MEIDQEKIETSFAHVAPGKGSKSLCVFGELVMWKVTSHQTGGAYSLFEVVPRPGDGPPPHVQHREDEAFYVLEGEYELKGILGASPYPISPEAAAKGAAWQQQARCSASPILVVYGWHTATLPGTPKVE